MTAALVALAVAAGPATPAPPPPLEVLEAGQLDYDVARERGVVTGGVVLRRGQVTLRADTASYDERTGEVDAQGRVLLTEPGRAISAAAMHAVLDGPYEAHDVVAYLKDAPLDLSRCTSLEEARTTGRNGTTVGGAVVTGEGRGRFEIDRARVTLCDCGSGAPSWEIRSHHAEVEPGNRAALSWPVFYVTPRFLLIDTPIPVFALPWVSLPLSDRQTGLLLPALTFGGPAGFGVSQPVFITLGRSWDATVTADYVFGPSAHAANGPGTSAELRWAPAEGVRGGVKVSLLHAISHDWPTGVALPPNWNRVAVSGVHDQRLGPDTQLRIELGLVGDPLYTSDFVGDALLRATEYRRNAVALTHRTDDAVFAADAAYLLPMAYLDSGTAERAPFGIFGGDLSVFHRLPSASVTVLPVRLAGPLHLSGTAGVARFAPVRGATGDEGVGGVGPGERGWSSAAIDAGERDGRWDGPGAAGPGERLAATRALARAELRAPVAIAGALLAEPWVAGTAAAYAFETGPGPRAAARAAGGLALSTEIARTYGAGANRIRHAIEPRVEWRGGTGQAGPGLPNYAYDELDVALPPRAVGPTGEVLAQRTLSATPGSFSQLQLAVRNRLAVPAGALSSALLDLTLGQDLDLATGTASETWARAGLQVPHVTADATARFRAFGAAAPAGTPKPVSPSSLDAFTELSASVTVFDDRGDNLHASFIALGAGGSPRVLAGLEPFFDPRPVAESAVALGQVGAALRWSGATVAYDALFYGRDIASTATTCPGTGRTISPHPHVYQHQGSLVWDSPCHCWKAGVSAIWNECDDRPRFSVVFDLSSLGARALAH